MHAFISSVFVGPRRVAVAVMLAASLAGCAAQQHQQDSQRLFAEGQVDQGLSSLREAIRLDPGNAQYRVEYANRVGEQVEHALRRAEAARERGDVPAARQAYRDALKFESGNELARRGLSELEQDARHAATLAEAEQLLARGRAEEARDLANAVRRENPGSAQAQDLLRRITRQEESQRREQEAAAAAKSILKRPVTLQFRDANLRMVFEALSRTTGLNVVFDRDVRSDLKTTIFVKDGSVEDTVDLILLQNQLEKKVLNANTMFVYPATPAKEKEYQELKVRTFHISNGDAKYIQGMLKSVLKIKEVQVDERTNTLVLRDTPESLAVAAKVIGAHDLADAEVMLEVQVLEVSRDRMTNLGIKWPDGFALATPVDANGTLTLGGLRDLTSSQLLVTPLQLGVNFKLQDTDANILASPRIRVRDREKAKILIGDKVPVITNAVTPVASGSAVVTGSIQYIDVGIKLEAEPHVYDEGEIGIKLNLEVSNIAKEITGAGGSLAYQIGTRMASTSLRLRDGETQVLGGLISDSDRNTAARVPGIGQLPVLGRLFSNNNGDNSKTEIILSITPHIVRAKGASDESMSDAWSGTDARVRERPLRLDPVSSVRAGAASGSTYNPPRAMTAPAAPAAQPAVPAIPAVPAMPTQAEPRSAPAPAAAPAAAPRPAAAAAESAGTPGLSWGPPAEIRRGDQFSVSVNAADFSGVTSIPVAIQYDPQVLSYVGASLGELATRAGADSIEPVVNQNAGRLSVTLTPGKDSSFSGSGELVRLTFTAKLPRPATQLALARVDLHEGSETHMIARPQPLTLKVDP